MTIGPSIAASTFVLAVLLSSAGPTAAAPARAQPAGCVLDAVRNVAPGRATVGEALTITLTVSASDACARFRRPRRAMLALQPPRPTEARGDAGRLADAFAAAVLDGGGRLGIAIAGPRQPERLAPTDDRQGFRIRLEGARAHDPALNPGTAGPEAIEAALDAMSPIVGYHDAVYYVAHRDSLLGLPERWAAARERAARAGIELVLVCLGGGCDPAATWDWQGADLGALAAAVAGSLVAGRPVPERTVAAVEVVERVDPSFDAPEGAVPEALRAGAELRWTLPIAPGQTHVLRYRTRAVAWGERRIAAGGVRWSVPAVGGGEHVEAGRVGDAIVAVQPPVDVACVEAVDRRVEPSRVVLGDPVTVTLEAGAGCFGQVPYDVVLVLDVSGSMEGAKIEAARAGLEAMLDRLAVLPARVALVTFDIVALERIPLTTDVGRVRAAVGAQRSTGGSTRLAAGLRAARELLADRSPDRAALVVVAADGASADAAGIAQAAADLAAAGAGLAVVCPLGLCRRELRDLAIDPSLVFEGSDGAELDDRLDALGARLADPAIGGLVVVEEPAASFVPDRGSADPPAEPGAGPALRWRVPPSGGAATVRYRGEPLLLGPQPTLRRGEVHIRTALGVTRTLPLPDPGVETFVDAGSGPCQARTARTAAPARVALGAPVAVTLTLSFDCPVPPGHVDAVLVVDHSDSMRALDRLTSAKAAVRAFAAGLVPARTRLGLVAFSDAVSLALPLTSDLDAVLRAVDGLEPRGGTAIAAALRRAAELMEDRRPDVVPVVVLLTDGRDPAGTEGALRAAAQALTAEGIELSTVCAGDCGPELASLASRPELAFDGVDSVQLVGLFERLAATLASIAATTDVVVRDGLSAAVAAEAGSFAPPPERLWGHEARWRLGRLEVGARATLAYRVLPSVAGTVATSRFGRVDYRYGPVERGHAWFPIPVVEVDAPAVPATPTPGPGGGASPTPGGPASATPASNARRLWLPIARVDRP